MSLSADDGWTGLTVLGMHRSGTSLVASALCALGAWPGPDDDLLGPDAFNEAGYFERRSTLADLDGLLDQLGGEWHRPPVQTLLEPEGAVQQRLADILRRAAQGLPLGRVPLVKDPRLSLFSALLPKLLQDTRGVIVCVRHPLAVARSVHQRDGLSIAYALTLWEIYHAIICNGLSGQPVRLWLLHSNNSSEWLATWAAEALRGIGHEPNFMGIGSVRFDADRLHHEVTAEDEDTWLSVAQMRLWERLKACAAEEQPVALPEAGPSALARANVLSAGVNGAAERQNEALHVDRARIAAALEAAKEEVTQLREELAVAHRRAEHLERRIVAQSDVLHEIQSSYAGLLGERSVQTGRPDGGRQAREGQ
ncbi:MAG: hypothetical protein JWP14_2149 [Frankiales bacterium]|nr:hypothetical protein [Frankiales bacterium]